MEKGKFGISIPVIGVIAFIFGVLRQPQSVLLVVGFALLAEKSEWLNRQVMQSLLLTITYYLAILVSDWILGGISRSFAFIEYYNASIAIGKVNSFVGGVLYVALVVFSVFAIVKVLKGKDAGLPCLSKLVDGQLVTNLSSRAQQVKPAYTPPVQVEPAVPNKPGVIVPTMPEPASQPVGEATLCPTCSATLESDARFCAECGRQV